MEYIFKNPELKKDFELVKQTENLSPKEMNEFFKRHKLSEQKAVFHVLLAYTDSLLEFAEQYRESGDKEASLDLTYDTVKYLPQVLGQQFYAYVLSRSFPPDKSVEILKKTFAAYLMALCVNEHGCVPAVILPDNLAQKLSELAPNETTPDSWSGTVVKVGTKAKYDMLPELRTAVSVNSEGVLRVRVSRAIEIYKRMCGVDLKEKGLDNLEAKLNGDQ